jgi:hypothetical protein
MISAVGVVTGSAVTSSDGIMNVFPVPVLIVALETDFYLIRQRKLMFAFLYMAAGTIIIRREMQFFQLFKFRMTLRGGAVVTIRR